MVTAGWRMGRGMANESRLSKTKKVRTNLRVLKRSNKAPQRGDVFAMQLPSGEFLFGRVIVANAHRGHAPMPGANLIYVYDQRSGSLPPDLAQLLPGRLLVPPLWTNRLPWTKGYFQTVRNQPLGEFDVLRQHCFQEPALSPGAVRPFVDQTGRRLSNRVEPCGEWGLVSYRWIDDHISDALGIPRVPED